MALTRSIGAYDDGTVLAPGVGTTPLDTRKSLSALWASAGVVAGGPSPLVTGTAGFAYSVAGPVPFVTTRGASDGFAMFTNDGAASVTCPGAPGSGLQRIDILWVRHPTNTENSDTSSAPIFGVASGTAVSSSPAAPSIPTGALELARNTMTSAATSTASAGNTIAQTAAVAAPRIPAEIGPWTAYTPTLTGFTLGTGSMSVQYRREGIDLVRVRYLFTLCSASMTSTPKFSLPFTSVALRHTFEVIGFGSLAIGGGRYVSVVDLSSTTQAQINYLGVSGLMSDVSMTAPAAWSNWDSLAGEFTYRVA